MRGAPYKLALGAYSCFLPPGGSNGAEEGVCFFSAECAFIDEGMSAQIAQDYQTAFHLGHLTPIRFEQIPAINRTEFILGNIFRTRLQWEAATLSCRATGVRRGGGFNCPSVAECASASHHRMRPGQEEPSMPDPRWSPAAPAAARGDRSIRVEPVDLGY